jgi:hypothetical protein
MLPMLFAPQDSQLIERSFEPLGPTAATLSVWPRARDLAESYWLRLCEESRLSEEFRRLCEECLRAVRRLSRRGAPGLDPRSRRSLAVLKIVILCARFTRS